MTFFEEKDVTGVLKATMRFCGAYNCVSMEFNLAIDCALAECQRRAMSFHLVFDHCM